MRVGECVLDASVLLRGLLGEAIEAEEIIKGIWAGDVVAHSPDLIAAESTHTLLRLTWAGRLDRDDARLLAGAIDRTPIELHPARGVSTALELAQAARISGYDAVYAVLSELLGLPLVTADRKLAAAVPNAILVG